MALEPWSSVVARRHLRRIGDPEPAQRDLLRTIVNDCHDSAVGKALGLRPEMTFEEFLGIAPQDYQFYDPFIERVLNRESGVFGQDAIVALGETSGSMGQPKLIPHTASSLACFARATRILILFQLRNSPYYLPRFTRWLCITASSNVRYHQSIAIGFISGLIYQQASATRLLPVLPSAPIAALENWDERVKRVAIEALTQRIGTLLGVPAYLEHFLAEAALQAGTKRLAEIWPWLDEVYYSGTSIDAQRTVLQSHFDRPLLFRSIYSATEGVFAVELDRDGGGWMRLLPDMAVCTFRDIDNSAAPLRAMWQLEPGRRYELLVTTAPDCASIALAMFWRPTQRILTSCACAWPAAWVMKLTSPPKNYRANKRRRPSPSWVGNWVSPSRASWWFPIQPVRDGMYGRSRNKGRSSLMTSRGASTRSWRRINPSYKALRRMTRFCKGRAWCCYDRGTLTSTFDVV